MTHIINIIFISSQYIAGAAKDPIAAESVRSRLSDAEWVCDMHIMMIMII
jgi:hypothetical protein